MSTYAAPIDPLWTGMMIPGTNTPMSGYYAEFLTPGTSTRKDAYDDASKQVAVQTKALNSSGRAQTFGDGVYDIKFYAGDPDADPSLVSVLTLSNYKVRDPLGNSRTITQDTTGSVDDQLVLVNTTSGNVTYTLPDAAMVGARSIIVQKTPSGSNTMTIAAAPGQQVNGAASVSYTVVNSGARFVSDGSNWYAPDHVTNADTVDGIHASATPTANKLLPLDSDAEIPDSVLPGSATATAGNYLKRDSSARGKVAEAQTSDQIPTLNQTIPGMIVWEQQTAGTNGGTFTSGAWQVRTLNTEHRNVITAGYSARANSTAYALNDIRTATASDGKVRWYTCTTAGTSDGTPPTFPTSGTVADGTVVWTHGGQNAASLASNKITLPAGTYYVRAVAPASACNQNAARISRVYTARANSTAYALNDVRSATASDGEERWYTCTTAGTSDGTPPTFPTSGTVADGTVVWTHGGETALRKGQSSYAASADNNNTNALVEGVFTLSVEAEIELRHRCQTTSATTGLGTGASFTVSIFSIVSLWKIN